MDLKKLKNLQQDLLGIIFLIVAEASEEEISNMQDRALKIIDELRDHINDNIEINDNLRMPTLDCIAFCDSHDGVRLNNRSLLDLEDAVKSIGGKTSQELGQVREIPEQMDDLGLAEIVAQYQAHVREREERQLRKIGNLTSAIISHLTALGTRFGRSNGQVGGVVGATLGGLLSVPIILMSSTALITPLVGGLGHRTSREIAQEVVQVYLDSTSEPMVGLSAALGAGITTFEINMGFGESLRSGLIAAAGAGIGAALSTALTRRMFTPVSTNLENIATEQPNMQGQNI